MQLPRLDLEAQPSDLRAKMSELSDCNSTWSLPSVKLEGRVAVLDLGGGRHAVWIRHLHGPRRQRGRTPCRHQEQLLALPDHLTEGRNPSRPELLREMPNLKWGPPRRLCAGVGLEELTDDVKKMGMPLWTLKCPRRGSLRGLGAQGDSVVYLRESSERSLY